VNHRLEGSAWETRAERFLKERGLHTLCRNFLCRAGEIDLVMQDVDTTVFVEVRYRGDGSRVEALESVDRHKQARLSRAAGVFLHRHAALGAGPCRFDVVAFAANGSPMWVRNAFESTVV